MPSLAHLSALLCCAGAVQLPRLSLKETTARGGSQHVLVDDTGREVFLHGANMIVKGPPYVPSRDGYDNKTSLVKEDFITMQRSGINFIRLGVMWPGLEPIEGQYNMTYLQLIEDIVQEAAEYGIYTLADMHQDDLSERYCGEGIPLWAAQGEELVEFPIPVKAERYKLDGKKMPTRQECAKGNWPSYYSSAACSNAFEKLYTDEKLVTSWSNFWAKLAERFTGNSNILGYELINEPWVGDIYKNPTLLIPGVADEERLSPVYDKLNTAIRAHDADGLIFFAGNTWDRDGDKISDNLPWGFKHPPGGASEAGKSVVAFHYYTPPQLAKDFKSYFETRRRDAEKLKTGMFLTETNAWNGKQDVLEEAESFGISWGAWEWKDLCKETPETLNSTSQYAAFGACKTGYGGVIDSTSAANTNKYLHMIARTYAPQVSGSFLTSSFNSTTGEFSVQFLYSKSVSAPTMVFYYPDRYQSLKIQVIPEGSFTWTKGIFNATFSAAGSTPDGEKITIQLSHQ